MRLYDLEFSLIEFAGAFGDFGTLLAFVVAYITICKLNPTGIFIGIGTPNICLAVIQKLPLPLQPKSIAVIAIREKCREETVLCHPLLTAYDHSK